MGYIGHGADICEYFPTLQDLQQQIDAYMLPGAWRHLNFRRLGM